MPKSPLLSKVARKKSALSPGYPRYSKDRVAKEYLGFWRLRPPLLMNGQHRLAAMDLHTYLTTSSIMRPPNPKAKGIQWKLLSAKETSLLKSFLRRLKKAQPVRVKITPRLATAILVGMGWTRPRNLHLRRVAYFANEMAKGNWQAPTSLTFNEDKSGLVDGQVRLAAQEMAGVTLTCTCILIDPKNEHVSILPAKRSLPSSGRTAKRKTA